jgi:hypothetical protein
VQSKTYIWLELLKRNHTFLFSDPDTVWLSPHILEHVTFVMTHSYAHVLFSREPSYHNKLFNTGFFLARPTPVSVQLFQTIIERIRADPSDAKEQHLLNDMMIKSKFNDSRLEGLDLFMYTSGNLYFKDEMNDKLELKPYVVHSTYFSGRTAKIRAFKSKRLWYVENEE